MRFLSDVIDARLTGFHGDTVATRAFRENDQVKFLSAPAKLLQLVEAVGIQLSAFKQVGAFAGDDATNQRGVPDVFAAQHKNRITVTTPHQRAEKQRVEQTDVAAYENIAAARIKLGHAEGATEIGSASSTFMLNPMHHCAKRTLVVMRRGAGVLA